MPQSRIVVALLFLLGALMPAVVQRTSFPYIVVPVLVGLIAGTLGGWLAPTKIEQSTVSVVFGVFVGLSVDAAVDWIFFNHDRRLLGIEWILWELAFGLPTALAVWIAGTVKRRMLKGRGDEAV